MRITLNLLVDEHTMKLAKKKRDRSCELTTDVWASEVLLPLFVRLPICIVVVLPSSLLTFDLLVSSLHLSPHFFLSPPPKVVFSDPNDEPPQLRVPSLLLAILKVALKALHEATRLTTFQSPAVIKQTAPQEE